MTSYDQLKTAFEFLRNIKPVTHAELINYERAFVDYHTNPPKPIVIPKPQLPNPSIFVGKFEQWEFSPDKKRK